MINDYPQALTIAGTDSGGGAGIPADVKTMQMRGVYSAMVVVAVTAQNTLGVQDALPMPEKLIDEQFASIAGDLKIRACKTGMLADPIRVRAVVRNLKKYDLDIISNVLSKYGEDLNVRAEALEVDVFVDIANALYNK